MTMSATVTVIGGLRPPGCVVLDPLSRSSIATTCGSSNNRGVFMTITSSPSCWCYGMYCSSIATTFPSFVVIQYGDDSAEPSKERKSSANRLRLTTVRSSDIGETSNGHLRRRIDLDHPPARVLVPDVETIGACVPRW